VIHARSQLEGSYRELARLVEQRGQEQRQQPEQPQQRTRQPRQPGPEESSRPQGRQEVQLEGNQIQVRRRILSARDVVPELHGQRGSQTRIDLLQHGNLCTIALLGSPTRRHAREDLHRRSLRRQCCDACGVVRRADLNHVGTTEVELAGGVANGP
jgi:hypothetical protein